MAASWTGRRSRRQAPTSRKSRCRPQNTYFKNFGDRTTPGAILPGVVGAIALVLVLYLAAILPVNVTGLALIALALMLFIFDVYAPTHGVLTVGGIISFLIGSLMLFNRADPLFRLSLNFIIPATLVTAAFFIFVIGKGVRAQMLPVKVGKETLIGRTVTALTPIDSRNGRIFVEGEYWNAVSDAPIEKGEEAEIAAVQGLTVTESKRRIKSCHYSKHCRN